MKYSVMTKFVLTAAVSRLFGGVEVYEMLNKI